MISRIPADLEVDRRYPTVEDVRTYTPGTRREVYARIPKIVGERTGGISLHIPAPNRTLYGDAIERFQKDREAWEKNQAKYSHKIQRAGELIYPVSPIFDDPQQVQWPVGAWRPSLNYNPTEFDQGGYRPSDKGDTLPILTAPVSKDLKKIEPPVLDNTLSPAKKFVFDPEMILDMPGAGLPGRVVGQSDDTTKYGVMIYPYGLDGEGRVITAKQLQITENEIVPVGTWVIVVRLRDPDDNIRYYMQVPVWL